MAVAKWLWHGLWQWLKVCHLPYMAGTIDFDEFASAMASSGDDLRQSVAGALRKREQTELMNMRRSNGRYGATPSLAYGVQVR